MSATEYRILLVDDDPDDQLIVEDLLGEVTTWVPRLTSASSYAEGLEHVRREPFDVALVDYRLGARRGDGFVSEPEVRAASLPVIILTGQGEIEADAAAARAGAADFLPKRDLTMALLERSIRYTVENHREHQRGDRFRAMIENSRDLLSIIDASGRLEYVSPSLERILGFAPHEKLGEPALGTVHRADAERVQREFARLLEEPERSIRLSYRVAHRDGSWRVLDTVAQNLLDEPLIRGIVVNSWDITELEGQRRQAQFQAALLQQVGQMVLAVDAEDRVIYWNLAAEAQTGYAAEEVMGRTILEEIVVADDLARGLEAREVAKGGTEWSGELRVRTKDGGTKLVQVTVSPMTDPAGGRIAVGADVTDLRRAQEERLRVAERVEFQASLLDAVGQAVIATDLDGRVTYWNRAAEEMFGWSEAEALGKPILDLTPTVEERGRAEEILQTLKSGERWVGEMELQRRDGSSLYGLVTDAPLIDDAGELAGIVGVTSDLSELRALEDQLRHAQKMEAVGRLAGGVAHDFNNLLTAIHGNAAILEDELGDDSPLREDVRQILRAADRASGLTRQLLAFSRKQVILPQLVDLVALLRAVEPMLRRLIPESVELRVELSPDRALVLADPGQLEQVVMNLVVNAIDAIPGAGTITIGLEMIQLSKADAPGDLTPGHHARLTVTDTGTGIDPALVDRLFEPFFTTKPEGKGTGLGLSTVYGITQQAHGHLDLLSTPGEGSTFRVWLPLALEGHTEPDPEQRAMPSTLPPERAVILLVEDDDGVRRLVKRTLERQLHIVIDASDGRSALAKAREHRAPIDLLISDVVMPAMSGHELAELLLAERPDLRVILTSGYSEADLRGEVRVISDAFLVKPFKPRDLLETVASVLRQ